MELSLEIIVFVLLLIDSAAANLVAWSGSDRWYYRTFRVFSRHFPLARGWTTLYIVLVLWIGALLYRFGALGV